MRQKSTKNWIDHMIFKAIENYNGRKIVVWGKYGISYVIKNELKEKYGIDIAFYVDSNISKTDGRTVFLPEYLYGKSDKYYVIIPIAFYQSVKDKLTGGGYNRNSDYYYFCDCVLRQETQYYEDLHGNKIIGNYQGLKFAFSGFYSVIEIGQNVQFQETVFYIHNDSRIEIGENTQMHKTVFSVDNESELKIGEDAQFMDNQICIHNSSEVIFGNEVCIRNNNVEIGDMSKLNMGTECNVSNTSISIKKCAQTLLEERVYVFSNNTRQTIWIIEEGANFTIGKKGNFSGQAGECFVCGKAQLKIGEGFSINGNYRIVVNQGTSVIIGDDCMFSYDISIRSNDGHSIFDIVSKENINSTNDVNKNRGIILGNHVWVGERACILYNTQIGDGSIIGAMSLVKSNIPNNCIAAGIPAKVIKKNVAWSREEGAEDLIKCGQAYVHYTEEVQ